MRTTIILRVIGVICCLTLHIVSASGQISDSLLNKLKGSKEDTNKVILLQNISASQIYNDPELGLAYASEALLLAQKIEYKRGEANSYFYIGVFCKLYGKLDESETYFKRAGEVYREIKNTKGEASVLGTIGGLYSDRGKYDIALRLRLAALKIDRANNFKQDESVNLMNIGIILANLNRFDDAENYFKQALKIKREINDRSGESMVYINYGSMLIDKERWNESLPYLEKAMEIQNELGEIRVITVCKSNLGIIYKGMGMHESALAAETEAFNFYGLMGDTSGMASTSTIIGSIYFEKGDFKKSEMAYLQSVELLNSTENKSPLKTAYVGLYELYKKTNNHKNSLDYLERITELDQDAHKEEVELKVAALKEQYEAERREQDILLLEEQNKAANALAEKRKLWPIIIGTISGSLLVLLLLLVTILILRNKHQKKVKEIELVRAKAEFEQKVLRAQMNPHFIFNSLNSIQHYILSNQTQYAYDYLTSFSDLIRKVLANSEHISISLRNEMEFLETYIELEQRRFKDRFTYELSYDKSLSLDEIKIPVMLVQPFIENAIWHGLMNLDKSKKGQLKLSFGSEQNMLRIIIEDNGIGRKAAEKLKSHNEYDSVGILFSQKRLEMLKLVSGKNAKIMVADLYHEDGSAKGTKVEILLPV